MTTNMIENAHRRYRNGIIRARKNISVRMAALIAAVCFALVFSGALVSVCLGQGDVGEQGHGASNDGQGGLFTAEAVEKRTKELDSLIEVGRKGIEAVKDKDPDADWNALQDRILLLSKIKSAYLSLKSAGEKNAQLAGESDSVRQKLAASPERIVSKPPPYSLNFYDDLLNSQEIARQKKEAADFALKMARLSLDDADKNLEAAQGSFEAAKSATSQSAPAGVGADESLGNSLRTAELDLELAKVNRRISEVLLENHAADSTLAGLNSQLLARQLDRVRTALDFNPKDLQEYIGKIDERRNKLEKQQEKLLGEQKEVEKRWHQAKTDLMKNVRKDQEEVLKSESLAKEAWLNAYHIALEQIGTRIQLLEHEKEIARKRYKLMFGDFDRTELLQWEDEVDERIAESSKVLSLQQNYQATLQSQIGLLENQIEELPQGDNTKKSLEDRLKANKKLSAFYGEYIAGILNTLTVDQKFKSEIVSRIKEVGISGQVWAFMAESRIAGALIIATAAILVALLVGLFMNRIMTILVKKTHHRFDDHILKMVRKPVFLTILLAGALSSVKWARPGPPLEFFLLGLLKTSLIVLWSMTVLRIIRGIGENAVSNWKRSRRSGIEMIRLVENLARLVAIVGSAFLLLSVWEIDVTPLLASAGIAGVAVALAAKETLANLFGGISLMLDQPFKTGDYIILDSGERGEVREIGLRSTRVWSRDDIMISIPNSIITNSKIVNESAPLPSFRVRIKIGVAYGSDIGLVQKVLLEVARKNTTVVQVPEPRVRFRNFGDSSLDFELLCWGRSPEQKGFLVHQLNCEVYEAFNEAGISIPFPQRDVHLFHVPGSV